MKGLMMKAIPHMGLACAVGVGGELTAQEADRSPKIEELMRLRKIILKPRQEHIV